MAALLVFVAAGCGGGGSSSESTTSADTSGTTTASLAGKKACMDQYVTAEPTDEIVKGAGPVLEKAGIDFNVQNSQAEAANVQTILQKFVNEGCEIFLPVATPTAQATAKVVTEKPVVFFGSSTPVEAGLVESLEHPGGNVTGVSDPFPVDAEIDAMLEIDPAIKTMGLIWRDGDPAGDVLAKQAEEHLEEKGINIETATITNAGEMSQAAQALAGKVDAIMLPGDTTSISAAPAAIKVASAEHIPLFGATSDTVAKGGLLAGTYDYEDVGKKGAEMAVEILEGTDPGTIPVFIPNANAVKLTVNEKVAKELGLKIPASLEAVPSE
jgi:putative ABC transport system substrate-binding protein